MIGYGDANDWRGLDELERMEAGAVELESMIADIEELLSELDAEAASVRRDS